MDKTWGSPDHGWLPICDGKSLLNGGKKGLLKAPILSKEVVGVAPPPITAQGDPEPPPAAVDRDEVSKALNQLARARMKEKLLQDLAVDLMVCKMEGYSCSQYAQELKDLIDDIVHRVTRGR